MRIHRLLLLCVVPFLPGCACTSAMGQESSAGKVMVNFAILVGFPSDEQMATGGSLLVPGTVIPISVEADGSPESVSKAILARSLSFSKVAAKLWGTFRLDPARRTQKGKYAAAEVDEPIDLPLLEGADVRITATLVGYNDAVATFRVIFRQGEMSLADSTVSISRGGRAVVGGMDGEAAPYIFVLLEPEKAVPESEITRFRKGMGITEPSVIHRIQPKYPKEARRDRISGQVILEATIDTEGRVQSISVLADPDPRLTQAAIEAVRQWIFEPARNEDGTPVMVRTAVTLMFRLR